MSDRECLLIGTGLWRLEWKCHFGWYKFSIIPPAENNFEHNTLLSTPESIILCFFEYNPTDLNDVATVRFFFRILLFTFSTIKGPWKEVRLSFMSDEIYVNKIFLLFFWERWSVVTACTWLYYNYTKIELHLSITQRCMLMGGWLNGSWNMVAAVGYESVPALIQNTLGCVHARLGLAIDFAIYRVTGNFKVLKIHIFPRIQRTRQL